MLENVWKWEKMIVFLQIKFFVMFIGDYPSKIDEKGRAVVPFQLLRQIEENSRQEGFVVQKDIYDKCLSIFPLSEWNKRVEKLKKRLNPYNKEHDQFLKEFFRGIIDVTLDKNNRILLPKRMLEFLDNTKDVVFASQPDRLTLWSKERYDSKGMTQEEYIAKTQEYLGSIDFFED